MSQRANAADTVEGFTPSVRQLAHELNSMLDGSMRSIRLAQQELQDRLASEGDSDVISRLNIAQESLNNMAALLERVMRGERVLLEDNRPLGTYVPRILATCAPMAEQARVRLDLHIAEDAAKLATGPLGPIILNGVRNGIEACAASAEARCHQVEVSIGINNHNQLEVIIADTGTGAASEQMNNKPGGHGIGLELCRRLAGDVGGTVELMYVPFGGGAVLRVLIPVGRLQRA